MTSNCRVGARSDVVGAEAAVAGRGEPKTEATLGPCRATDLLIPFGRAIVRYSAIVNRSVLERRLREGAADSILVRAV